MKLKETDFFLETEEIFSNFYGTPKTEKEDLIFNIDIKGLYNLKRSLNLISIGIITSPFELEKRLIARGDKDIKERMKRYPFEVSRMKNLDFLVINDKLDVAFSLVEDIINIHIHKKKANQILETLETIE